MLTTARRTLLAAVVLAFSVARAAAQPSAPTSVLPSIEDRTRGFEKIDGFFPLYWDAQKGELWLEVPRFDSEVLYVTSLSAGLGSNDIGLDRGQLGAQHIVTFKRIGPKVLMIEPNYGWRTVTTDRDERRAAEESFARSVLWGFTVEAEARGCVLVNATKLVMRDVHGVSETLKHGYAVDDSRSAINLDRTKAFPKNTEIDVLLTFVTSSTDVDGAGNGQPGGRVTDIAPTPQAVTLQQHHSFVELPGPGYEPLPYDPRSGFFDLDYRDYSTPIAEPLVKRLIQRHRLQKRDPSAPVSDPVAPIVYYLDRGAPEPIRSALLEGARWWNQAFEAAGYRNAFRVEMMPEGADPLDLRYNVIQWVHRSTRGWSNGATVVDPRTGEILKGHVTLGSLRVRQDFLIAEGLLSPYTTGTETPPQMEQMALARLRQLAAHEVGHTLGLGHNYYDSSAGWISVMDYPQPQVTLRPDGTIDLSRAYADHIGDWDKIAITYGYGTFPSGVTGAAARSALLEQALTRDLRYLTNQDIDYTPRADQWSLGNEPATELARVMKVRRAALDRLGEATIRRGTPMSLIEEALVPVFLYHRYQVEATASALGGQLYSYAMRGDTRPPTRPVPAVEQHAALEALAATLAPAELVVPNQVLASLPPRPSGFDRHRELFPRFTGLPFDPIAPGLVAADLTITMALQPDRAARLIAQHALDPSLPSLGDVVRRLVTATFDAKTATSYEAEIGRATQRALADRLMFLGEQAPMPQVRSVASAELRRLQMRLRRPAVVATSSEAAAHAQSLAADIKRFLERPADASKPAKLPAIPPGAPIGSPDAAWLDADEGWCSMTAPGGSAFFPPLFTH